MSALQLGQIPLSTLLLLLVAAAISFLTTLVNRLFTNPEKSRVWRKEVADWNKELREAQKSGDKKQTEKVMKKQQRIMQIQSKMMWNSMKVMLIFLVPLLIIWQLLGQIFTGPVAYFPGVGPDLPIPFFNISIVWWYLICSLFFGTVFSHVFGLTEISD
jgi:uncharacterized membrane protein (DUF106 family)